MEIGWKIENRMQTDYHLEQNFNLSLEESTIYSLMLERFGKNSQTTNANIMPAKNALHAILLEICNERKHLMLKDRSVLIKDLAIASLELGVLDFLLCDESLEEIAISKIDGPIRVYRRGIGWMDTNACITSREFAIEIVNKMARHTGRRISFSNPMINAQLKNGSRLHASISLIDEKQVEITIRNFPKIPINFSDLEKNGMISKEGAQFLQKVAKTDASILFCGNTGSGKTTLLNAFFQHVPLMDRIIVIEETPEIKIPQLHAIKLVANDEISLGMKELTENTLRMRPDRLIIGEVRTEKELKALFLSLQAGQARGCYGTFHAQSAIEAINRIQSMGILKTDIDSLNLMVVCKRVPIFLDGKIFEKRHVLEISEVNGGIPVKIFEFDDSLGKLQLNWKNYQKSQIKSKIDRVFSNGN